MGLTGLARLLDVRLLLHHVRTWRDRRVGVTRSSDALRASGLHVLREHRVTRHNDPLALRGHLAGRSSWRAGLSKPLLLLLLLHKGVLRCCELLVVDLLLHLLLHRLALSRRHAIRLLLPLVREDMLRLLADGILTRLQVAHRHVLVLLPHLLYAGEGLRKRQTCKIIGVCPVGLTSL